MTLNQFLAAVASDDCPYRTKSPWLVRDSSIITDQGENRIWNGAIWGSGQDPTPEIIGVTGVDLAVILNHLIKFGHGRADPGCQYFQTIRPADHETGEFKRHRVDECSPERAGRTSEVRSGTTPESSQGRTGETEPCDV